MENEPKDIIVLDAIKKGAKKFDKIEKITKISGKELNDILERLEEKGFITVVEKKVFFSTKKEIALTQKGDKEFEERKFELQNKWNHMVSMWKSGDKQQLQEYADNNKGFMRTMMFLGIIDIIMFTSMMSFMGLALSSYLPEHQMPSDGSSSNHDAPDSDTGTDGGTDMGDGGDFDIDIGF